MSFSQFFSILVLLYFILSHITPFLDLSNSFLDLFNYSLDLFNSIFNF